MPEEVVPSVCSSALVRISLPARQFLINRFSCFGSDPAHLPTLPALPIGTVRYLLQYTHPVVRTPEDSIRRKNSKNEASRCRSSDKQQSSQQKRLPGFLWPSRQPLHRFLWCFHRRQLALRSKVPVPSQLLHRAFFRVSLAP